MKIAVIGAGAWGKNHVRTLSQMGMLGAVIDASADLRTGVETDHPGIPTFESVDSFLEASDVEAVVIATPAHTHTHIGLQCLNAGRHALIEKPMTLSSAEAEELIATANSVGRTLMVGHLLLFQPAISFIQDYLQSGKLGTVYSLHQVRSKLGRARSHEDVLWSFGVHDIAVLLFLIGSSPTRVHGLGHCGVQPAIADDFHLQMEFHGGVHAYLHNSWLWPSVERKLTIAGSDGIIVYDELTQDVVLHKKTITNDLQNADQGEEILFKGNAQPLELELEHFIHCCKTGETPIASGENGLEVIRVLESASKPQS